MPNTYIICMVIFSKHSLQRMNERGFQKDSVLSIIKKETDVIVYPSTRDIDIDLYFGKIDGNYLLVVYNRKTEIIITVRNMRKKEKVIFNEVINDEKE